MSTPATLLTPADEVDAARVLLAEKTPIAMPALSSVVLIHRATVIFDTGLCGLMKLIGTCQLQLTLMSCVFARYTPPRHNRNG